MGSLADTSQIRPGIPIQPCQAAACPSVQRARNTTRCRPHSRPACNTTVRPVPGLPLSSLTKDSDMLSRLKTVTAAAMLAAAMATSATAIAGPLKNSSPAPEFTGIEKWLNSDPLTIQQLRGKVVLVDFWTYTCVNCINTLPYVKGWNQKYKDQGLAVIGVHTPEFPFERSTDNVRKAIKRF